MGTRYFVSADTGGTFTDFVALDGTSGEITTFKLPSVPDDPARAVARGLERLADRHGIPPSAIARFIFGTTVATNATLERTGARVALIATRGTRDVLEIQRQWRHRLFDLDLVKPEPLVPRRWRIEADERVGADGATVARLSAAEAERIARVVADLGVESVAVVLIFSFLDSTHERRIARALRARAPDLRISLSSDVCPEFREFERSATTAMNAYVMPKIHHLVDRLETELTAASCGAPLRIIQSNGGLMSAERARALPVHTLLSGPAGGVVGAAAVAGAAGHDDVITIDMGGTSLDICMVRGGRIELAPEGRIGGLPVKIPQIDVHTIGAGGGSIARLVRGSLKVGPKSAGADPGPACYGRGSTEPTCTDAAVVLGYIGPESFAGGEITLDAAAARTALQDGVATPLGLDARAAAMAVVRVQVANMVTGIRAVSVERGLDPRDFTLMPFGGAGALFAGQVAEELDIRTMVVPVHQSVLSALGMLMTDVKYARGATRLVAAASTDAATVRSLYREIETSLLAELSSDGIDRADVRFVRSCDMRYHGQAYEVSVPVPLDGDDGVDFAALIGGFHREHRRLYGAASEDEAIDLVNYRVVAFGKVEKAALGHLPRGRRSGSPRGRRSACFGVDAVARDCPVYDRASLAPGQRIRGPALIEEPGATVVVCPRHDCEIDAYGNIVCTVPVP
jgi:N-methylhydantoinase A